MVIAENIDTLISSLNFVWKTEDELITSELDGGGKEQEKLTVLQLNPLNDYAYEQQFVFDSEERNKKFAINSMAVMQVEDSGSFEGETDVLESLDNSAVVMLHIA